MTASEDTEQQLQRLRDDLNGDRRGLNANQLIVKDFKAAVLQALTFFASALLALSMIVPFWEADFDDRDTATYNLLSSTFRILGYRNEKGETDGLNIFFGIAFLILLVVIITTILLLLRIGAAGDFLPAGALKKTTCVLLGLGVLGAWGTSTLPGDWSWHPALPLMTVAALLAVPLLSCSTTNA